MSSTVKVRKTTYTQKNAFASASCLLPLAAAAAPDGTPSRHHNTVAGDQDVRKLDCPVAALSVDSLAGDVQGRLMQVVWEQWKDERTARKLIGSYYRYRQ